MKKNTTNSSKWFFMMAVIVIGIFGTNTHFHHDEIAASVAFTKITPMHTPKMVSRPLNVIDPLQLECLAKNIYYEARGESVKGQIAVARVVMNRVKHHAFGNTPCKVINQANMVTVINGEGERETVKVCQFSWVCEPRAPVNKNSASYQNALSIAKDVLLYDAHADLLPGNTLFFHSVNVNPNWRYRRVAVIGNHVFYAR